MNTHAVYHLPTGATNSEHPDASSAFTAAICMGGERYGYVVGPIGCPPNPTEVEVVEARVEDGPELFEV